MIASQKFGGAAIITAALLMFTRTIPILASGAIAPQDFPPKTIAGTTNLAITAWGGWELSHLMLLAALVLFFTGYVVLYAELKQRGQKALGLLFMVTMGVGLLFFAIAGVIDGFLVPAVANHLGLMAELPSESTGMLVALSHEGALAFFGLAQTGIVLGIGLACVALWRARLLSRWLLATGAGLSGLALVGLVAGVYGGFWRTLETAGPTMLLFFLWQLAFGIALVRHKPTAVGEPHSHLRENPA